MEGGVPFKKSKIKNQKSKVNKKKQRTLDYRVWTKRGFTPLEKPYANKVKKNFLTGFTLVEIMVVVLIIGVLAAIVAPYYVRAREEAKAKVCIANLKEIEGAKERWAISLDVDRWAIPEWTELVPDFLKTQPRCPAGGSYTIGGSDTLPTCDIDTNQTAEKYDDHILYNY